jgi:quercetin dioxygenase-like cupin family protein
MEPQATKSAELEWQPLVEDGVKTSGLYVKVLRFDATAGRSPTFLLKFEPGASYPNHSHPAGEEVFVLEGTVRFGSIELAAGDYLYTAPNETHAVFSKSGCVMLLVVPEEVQIQ